jgi:hypothetical protein
MVSDTSRGTDLQVRSVSPTPLQFPKNYRKKSLLLSRSKSIFITHSDRREILAGKYKYYSTILL